MADIHHDNIAFGCLAEQIHKPGLLRGIAAPIGAHHNTPQFWRIKHMADQVLLNSGKERKDNHVVVQLKMGGHRLGEVGFQNTVLVESEIDTGFAQMGIIERVKGIELVRILFRRAVAPEQMAAEIDTYLGDHRRAVLVVCRSQFDARHQILLPVCTKLPDRKLGACQDDGFCQVAKHERQGRGRVRHRVCTM